MKFFSCVITTGLALASSTSFAHQNDQVRYRPESHAPAGVMADHQHRQGEWMVGYRTMSRDFSGLYSGSDKVSDSVAAAAGYSMVANSMSMDMHMLDIMYALNDDITLMLMPEYMTMNMSMRSVAMSGAMGGMDMGAHSGASHTGGHDHSVSGWGDTTLAALLRVYQRGPHQVHATLGVSLPTGSVDEQQADGRFVHYGMQLGSGTYDLVPSITYNGVAGLLSWGAQFGGEWRLESANDSGFAFGDQFNVLAWGAYRLADWVSASARLQYEKREDINGHYNGPHGHSSPPDLQANYGGEWVELGLGVNLVAQQGPLAGIRLGLEWLLPVSEYYNGLQVGRDAGLSMSLSYAL
ncbi:transporter [Pseudomaricurvus alcaniphilus]|uniref:transporter n=1 Tax=Pseudomaricurvus alcaniphilus TaxID=1166482 RepID=UPI00140B01BB|nr:transporter [Pseudomaricurvus alcaniphilus]NHN39482.1 transporter [Pseudomaricurvus alcaniphilus]